MKEKTATFNEIQDLLSEGKKVEVKTKNGEYTNVSDFIEKGVKPTYRIVLENGNSVKASEDHLFFTNAGWMMTEDLVVGETKVYCDDEEYSVVEECSYIGDQDIYDITVDHPESCYFAHGMLHHNSGKSLIANHALADCQQQGGVSVLIDTEHAADFDFMETIGLDPEGDFLYIPENRLEKIFEMIETVIEKVKEKDEDRPITVVVDSIAGSVTDNEREGKYGKEGYNTDKAIVLSQAMRKINGLISRENVLLIFTNQVRTDPSVMYGNPMVTPGGKAVKFHSSVRIRLRKSKKIKESGEIVGAKIRPVIDKNRLAPPHRDCNFDLYYNSGIADYGSWWEVLKDNDVIEHHSQGWYKIRKEDDSGYLQKSDLNDGGKDEMFKTQEGRFSKRLHNDDSFRERMYNRLVDAVTHEYEDGWVDRSNAEYVDEGDEEEAEEEESS